MTDFEFQAFSPDDVCTCDCLRRWHDDMPPFACENGAHGWSCPCKAFTLKKTAAVAAKDWEDYQAKKYPMRATEHWRIALGFMKSHGLEEQEGFQDKTAALTRLLTETWIRGMKGESEQCAQCGHQHLGQEGDCLQCGCFPFKRIEPRVDEAAKKT